MPANITDVDSFGTVSHPTDGDSVDGPGLQDMAQDLANRTRFLLNRAPGTEDDETVPQSLISIATPVNFTWDTPDMQWRQNSVASAGLLLFDLRLPKQGVLREVHVVVQGDAGHTFPIQTMPQITLYAKDPGSASAGTQIGQTVDSSATAGAYQVPHAISITGLSEVYDHDGYNRYYLTFEGETGTNSAINLDLINLFVVVDPA